MYATVQIEKFNHLKTMFIFKNKVKRKKETCVKHVPCTKKKKTFSK